MKTILCYGDSNTWGDPPGGGGVTRYEWNVRWPGVLQHLLGQEYRIIEDGLGGRTTCFEDPSCQNRNGLALLPVALEGHCPLDLLIVMLGTNDLKVCYNLTAIAIAQGAAELVKLAQSFDPAVPNILLVSPPHVVATENIENTQSFEGAIRKSQELEKHYRHFASQLGCYFFDAASVVKSSPRDGIHLDSKEHAILGEAISKEVMRIFKGV